MRCSICNQRLKAAESLARGVGPECAGKYAAFLASCGSSVAEIGTIAISGNATANRWIGRANTALRRGNARDAGYFIEQAQREFARADYGLEALAEAA